MAGRFSVSLRSGSYTVVEKKPPVGFQLDPTVHTFVIAADGQVLGLGAIANQRSKVPALPLSGGTSTDALVLAGMGLLMAAGIGGWIGRRRLLRSP